MLLRELDDTGNERVLRCAINERRPFEDRGNSEDGTGCDLLVRTFNRRKNHLCRIVHARNNLTVSLGIRGPENDDLVKVVCGLEVTDILTDLF